MTLSSQHEKCMHLFRLSQLHKSRLEHFQRVYYVLMKDFSVERCEKFGFTPGAFQQWL